MNVSELVAKLLTMPQELPVYITDEYGSEREVSDVEIEEAYRWSLRDVPRHVFFS